MAALGDLLSTGLSLLLSPPLKGTDFALVAAVLAVGADFPVAALVMGAGTVVLAVLPAVVDGVVVVLPAGFAPPVLVGVVLPEILGDFPATVAGLETEVVDAAVVVLIPLDAGFTGEGVVMLDRTVLLILVLSPVVVGLFMLPTVAALVGLCVPSPAVPVPPGLGATAAAFPPPCETGGGNFSSCGCGWDGAGEEEVEEEDPVPPTDPFPCFGWFGSMCAALCIYILA